MSYDEIKATFVREIENQSILEIDIDFYAKAMKIIKKNLSSEDEEKKLEAKILLTTLKKLFLIRLIKLFNHVIMHESKPSFPLPYEENKILEEVEKIFNIEKSENKPILEIKITEKEEKEEVGSQEKHLVEFLKPYGRIMTISGKAVGPFEKGDIAYLPLLYIKSLLEKNIIRVLDT